MPRIEQLAPRRLEFRHPPANRDDRHQSFRSSTAPEAEADDDERELHALTCGKLSISL